jgi:hypothetical protein
MQGDMMDKKMEQIVVRTTEKGEIEIVQSDIVQQEEIVIYLSPEQIDLLVEWLIEARDELHGGSCSDDPNG